jgi:hypothetical protein
MKPALEPRVSEEGAQGDLVATREVVAAREVVVAMEVVEAAKENLAVAVAKELTVAAKEDTAVVREAMVVAAKKDLAAVLAEGEDGEGSRAIVLIMVHTADSTETIPDEGSTNLQEPA